MSKEEMPDTAKQFPCFRPGVGPMTVAADDGMVYESTEAGMNSYSTGTIVGLERSSEDPTELTVIQEGSTELLVYSFPEPTMRQEFYQHLLVWNPFANANSAPKSMDVNILLGVVDSSMEAPAADEISLPGGSDVYCFIIRGGNRDPWTNALTAHFEGQGFDATPELQAADENLPHDILTFVSPAVADLMSNIQNSIDKGAEPESSSGITFWVGETSYCIYVSQAEEYEDCYLGCWQLDLHQFRHVLAMGSGISGIPLAGGELAKGTCGSEGEFLWRSTPDLFEGFAEVSGTEGGACKGIECINIKAPACVPAVSEVSGSMVLVVDNLRASGVACEEGEAAYAYIGGQFVEDRRTSCKAGQANPVWSFEKKIGGAQQTSCEVLQLPTLCADPEYLKSQRLMIAIMDENKGEDDPILGYGFLPLTKCMAELDTAQEFSIDLTFFMSGTCSITGRLSAHKMDAGGSGGGGGGPEQKTTDDGGSANYKIIAQYFRRYDLDLSGTINSQDELQQLCTNLSVRLELTWGVNDIDAKVTAAGNMEELCWNLEQFITWFSAEFGVEVAQ